MNRMKKQILVDSIQRSTIEEQKSTFQFLYPNMENREKQKFVAKFIQLMENQWYDQDEWDVLPYTLLWL